PVIARSAAAYVSSVVTETASPQPLAVTVHTLYNPSLRSAYNFVPGILGMIFILVCAIMTSVSIVSEKESGSMDMLLVSPARPGLIILGKLIPYFILSCVLLALMLAISYIVLGLPFSAESLGSIILSLIYIVLSLSIGLLVSTLVATQLSALIVSAMLFMIPVIMLSGMIFPIDNMPQPLQWISTIVPARWYIEAMRRVMIQQLPLAAVWRELAMLGAMTLVLLSLAITKFRSRQ
ncbi:MAG: ABC transporter permease, partial [Muribaculaceae bacterium]|nr:ABC transporter permease [Muribaculaceae bacterium]